MTVLRSREILPKSPSQTRKTPSSPTVRPTTPAKQRERSTPAMDSTPSSSSSSPNERKSKVGLGFDSCAEERSDVLGLGSDWNSALSSGRRRSLRIASKTKGFDSEGKSERKTVSRGSAIRGENSRGCDVIEENVGALGSSEENVLEKTEMGLMDDDRIVQDEENAVVINVTDEVEGIEEKSRVMGCLEEDICEELQLDCGGDGKMKNGEEERTDEKESTRCLRNKRERVSDQSRGKGKRKSDVNLELSLSLLGVDGKEESGFLNLRSGARISRRRIEEAGVGGSDDGIESSGDRADKSGECTSVLITKAEPTGDGNSHVHSENRFSKRDKGKGILVEDNNMNPYLEELPLLDLVGREVCKEKECSNNNMDPYLKELPLLDLVGREFCQEKECSNKNMDPYVEELPSPKIARVSRPRTIITQAVRRRRMEARRISEMFEKAERERERADRTWEMFKSTARKNASKFAHFNADEEERDSESLAPVPETGTPLGEEADVGDPKIEDWPGPFTTAMNIIRDRAEKFSQRGNSIARASKSVPMIKWVPSKDNARIRSTPHVPTLQDLCVGVLHKNAEEIPSLEGVPDASKHKLSRLLCDSRKMGYHFLSLLFNGSPMEIRLKDCSWITEEQIERVLTDCNTDHLRVLQLDLCGRCMPDYVLRATLARSPNSLPTLTTLSIRGACRLSDVGLNALISSAPLLRSINLRQCSLLTSAGINSLANKLGSRLRELYLDDCLDVDAMLILPGLKKLKHLEVLSVGGIHTICDKFVRELIRECGPNMKELIFADCGKLTDASMKVIGQYCSGLHALDLANLQKLTDVGIQHIANGCGSLKKLKLRHNAFSDEAIAAFLEVSGASLIELSLNNVKKVSHNTAIAIAGHCSKTILSLDLSFCRNVTDEALGLIVDNCLLLRVLKVFGCTQITDVFLDGHSNPLVQIIGLKTGPILDHLDILDSPYGALRYSSAC